MPIINEGILSKRFCFLTPTTFFPIYIAMPSIDGAISSELAAKESAIQAQAAFAVAAKQLDATAQQGEAAAELLEAAAQLSKAIGKGQVFDAQA